MPDTISRPLRAQVWALAGTFLPAALVAVIAYTVTTRMGDTNCDGYGCVSFGYGLISAYAAFTAPLVGVLGQLATAGLGALWPSLRLRLGLLGALVSWIVLGLIVATF